MKVVEAELRALERVEAVRLAPKPASPCSLAKAFR
jgi:hypothetical protein